MLTPSGCKVGNTSPSSPTDRHAMYNFPIQYFGKEICQHSNGNKFHKVQESAASVVGDKHQAGDG